MRVIYCTVARFAGESNGIQNTPPWLNIIILELLAAEAFRGPGGYCMVVAHSSEVAWHSLVPMAPTNKSPNVRFNKK